MENQLPRLGYRKCSLAWSFNFVHRVRGLSMKFPIAALLTALVVFLPTDAVAQSIKLFQTEPIGTVVDGESTIASIDVGGISVELHLTTGESTAGTPAFMFSMMITDQDELENSGNTPNKEPHEPGDNPLDLDPRLPTRPKKGSPTLGIFEPDVETKLEIPLTSNPPKTPDGGLTGPGIDVQEEVLETFDEAHPNPSDEDKKLRDKIRISCEHTEGHAAGILHEYPEISGGTVTVNNPPCPNCQAGIPFILNEGQVLVVIYPEVPFGDPHSPKKTGYWVGGDPTFHDGEPPESGSDDGGSDDSSPPAN
jgi:hypothetical protein